MTIANLISALGWTLLHSLWQGALLYLLVVPLLRLLHDRPPQVRYGIACLALLLLSGGMVVTFGTQLEFSPAVSLAEGSPNGLPADQPAGETVRWPNRSAEPIAAPRAPRQAAGSLATLLEEHVFYLVGAWGLGVLCFTFRWCRMLLQTYRLRSRGISQVPGEWRNRLRRLQAKMGVNRLIGLSTSSRVDTPLVIGHLRPVILLPIGLVNGLSVRQVEAILAHELAHVQRQDFIINLLVASLEIVLFYHPAYWWLAGRINAEREACCDDAAVAACGDPRMYARTLLRVEEHRQAETFALAYAGKAGHLERRIQRICRVSPRHYYSVPARAWLLLPLLAGIATFVYAGRSTAVPGEGTPWLTATVEEASGQPGEINELRAPEETMVDRLRQPVAPPPAASLSALSTDPVAAPAASRNFHPRVPQVGAVPPTTVVATVDSLPAPSIPRLTTEPSLPKPPAIGFTAEEAAALLAIGEAGRDQIRKKVDAYRARVKDWNQRVDQTYLGVWADHSSQLMEAYGRWTGKLAKQADSPLAYALAHTSMTEAFEDAFEQHEEAMEKAGDLIERQAENSTEEMEELLERSEKRLNGHGDKMDLHGIRMALHGVRMQLHRGRMNVHGGRMQLHGSRMQLHGKRMESHEIIMTALEQDLREALVADGLLQAGEKYFHLRVTGDAVFFNGNRIEPTSRVQKYLDILTRYGKGDLHNPDTSFIIDHQENGSSVGTYYKRN